MRDCKKCSKETLCGTDLSGPCSLFDSRACHNCKYDCKVDREDCEAWERMT